MHRHSAGVAALALWIAGISWAGQVPGALPPTATSLTLPQAVAIALKSHPQIATAPNVAAAAGQRVTEARAPYYPTINAEVTGSQGLYASRLGAGSISTSLLFNR